MGIKRWIAGSVLAQSFAREREVKSTELFAGVEKPTHTLCHMLVAEMLQNLDVESSAKVTRRLSSESHEETCFRQFPKFKRVWRRRTYSSYYGKPAHDEIEYVIDGEVLSLEAEEKKILNDGFDQFIKLSNKRKAIKKEGERQEKAVDLIASFFKTEVTPDVHEVQPRHGDEASLQARRA